MRIRYYILFAFFITMHLFKVHSVQAQQISALGHGVGTLGIINCLEYDSVTNRLYAGGYFESINGVRAASIAYYDGTDWHPLSTGTNGSVYSIKRFGNDIYVGGNFQSAGGVAVHNIASWDGTSWHDAGQGVSAAVTSLQPFNGKLYVGGYFISAGNNTSIKYIATWDGITWQSAGISIDNTPINIKQLNNLLYVYGITEYDSITTDYSGGIYSYDGVLWQSIQVPTFYGVDDLTFYDNKLYGMWDKRLGYWSANTWTVTYTGTERLLKFANYNSYLYVSTDVESPTDFFLHNLFLKKVTGSSLAPPLVQSLYDLHRFEGAYNTFLEYDTSLYIGGMFTNMNSDSFCVSMARFDGAGIDDQFVCGGSYLDGFANSQVLTTWYDSTDNNLYIGGFFYFAGDSAAQNVARWDGTNWHPMGNGLNDGVYKLIKYNGYVYAAGNFRRSGSLEVNYISRWNGSSWEAIATGADAPTRDFLIDNNELYVGGSFTMFNGVAANYVAKYNGVVWTVVGTNNLDAPVFQLNKFNNEIIAGGRNFNFFSDSYVAKFSGGSWSAMGNLHYPAYCLHVFNGTLYSTSCIPVTLTMVHAWNGTDWDTLPSPLYSGTFPKLMSMNNTLFLGDINSGFYKFNGSGWDALLTLAPSSASQKDPLSYFMGGFFPYLYTNPFQPRLDLNNVCRIDFVMPQDSISASNDTICEHQYVFFHSQTNDPFIHYTWHLDGAIPDTVNQAEPIVQYLTAGTYAVYVVLTNLVGTDTVYLPYNIVVQNCTTGMDEQSQYGITLSPNPFQNNFLVSSGNDNLQQVAVFDLTGKKIFETNQLVNQRQVSLDLTGIAQGVLFVKIIAGQHSLVKKIIKQ